MSSVITTYPHVEKIPGTSTIKGKFVRILWHGEDRLIFAIKEEYPFHNLILGHFLEQVAGEVAWDRRDEQHHDLPQLTIRGGGKFLLDPQAGRLTLSGDSSVYGRFDESGLAAQIASSDHPFARLTLTIE